MRSKDTDPVNHERGLGRRPRKSHPEFDGTALYEYPTHLRHAIEDLPSLPGVYTFHGEERDLPLYIGKSINIRSRVLSHLRTPDEARLLRQTRRISCVRTAGEIGALLLEAHLIKTMLPLHNQRLRRSRQLFAWQIKDGAPELVNAKDVKFGQEAGLFGLYASRHSAMGQLRDLADTHGLCYGVLGLEKVSNGRPCFRAQLKQCLGACCGRESVESHQHRLEAAMRDLNVVCWPYTGAVALIERLEDMEDIHIVQNWCYLGSVKTLPEAKALGAVHANFDADSYRILCRPIVQASVEIVRL
ncbi:MAG: excinuclease Cho [Rhodoferax sp.]